MTVDLFQFIKEQQVVPEVAVDAASIAVQNGTEIEAALLEAGIEKTQLRTLLSQFYGVPAYEPKEGFRISNEILSMIPEDSARHYELTPLRKVDGLLEVAVNDPENIQAREVMNFLSAKNSLPYKFIFALKSDLKDLLMAYESLTGEVGEALTSLETDLGAAVEKKQKEQVRKPSQEHLEEDAPITKIVATIIRYAVDGNASDIHIEPFEDQLRVRFRVDGLLQTSLKLPPNVQAAVVARVKILSSMRLDEKRKPQDGRFSATINGRDIDFRVSVLPTSYGEKVVMRILDNERGVRSLADAGISPYNLERIKAAVKEPYGIILISGPTGSGKSTTLYSMLEEVDRETKNVLSLEDPVEYDIKGVSQSQMRPEIGYTFAAGLRSALRQDPDIIMVGEIRDRETAQLAIQAALTGHLVFSTIHTNNSIGVIPRLIDMGVDPYLIAPTLKLAVAQRLARRICPNTGREIPVEGDLKRDIERTFSTLPERYRKDIPKAESILYPEPSPGCSSGTKGRIAITECLPISTEIESLILKGGSEEQIYDLARKQGFISMKEDALVKALKHVIPYEEVGAFNTSVESEDEKFDLPLKNTNFDKVTEEVKEINMDEIDSVDATVNKTVDNSQHLNIT